MSIPPNQPSLVVGWPFYIGANWAAQFLQKYPQYVIQEQKPLVKEKKNAHKPKTFQTYYKDYCIAKTKKEIYNKDIYNFDKMKFWVGIGKDE